MPSEAVCSHCTLAFPVTAADAPWVECPRCRQRVVNPEALRHPEPRVTLAGCAGTLLVLGSIFGGMMWVAAALLASVYARNPNVGPGLVIGALIWSCVFVGGLLLIRAGEPRPNRLLMALGAGAALLAALALAAASGVLAVFVTCF